MRSYGFRIDIVRDEEFEAAVKEFAKTGQDSDAVSGLIAYTSHNENEIYTIDYSNRFTAQVLYRLDYKWPVTMEIITKTEGNKATMEISGWLDTQTAPQLGEALSGLEDSITSLVFDFTNLEYISSAGLRQVIVAYKKMAQKDGFKIINVSDEVYDVFSLTGFDSKIDIQKK